ncbi:polyprenyl synthetase family protein [Ignisphaera sp. 4213-co]|uniref:Polyprenyl synthetase family protein n=1 Tax=Ignisphaera cupida TaxID=3050454 RepID=A0ABD4Z5S3_9CREN|nr:polyprenyl synthetase family protein [Ignisphaera sp. 4213-co]MDK6028559.1 polyprenyl synthetase family protein [Ignisphaera sp. 4213-co]
MDLTSYASIIGKKVEQFIYTVVSGHPKKLYEASLHYIKAGGKRLRPVIVVLSSKIGGGSEEIAIPGAAAVEVLHTFTLVHDDIIDKDELRRGVPTVHKLWGVEMGIIAGDLLFAYAYKCLVKAMDYGVPSDRVAKSLDALTEAAITVAEGQALDMLLPEMPNASVEDYIDMVSKKTAALFAYSAKIGGLLAGADNALISNLFNAMMNAGIAFQIRDDILGLIGDEKVLGKPVYSDLREGKRTILVIYALKNVDENKKKRILSVLGNRDADVNSLREAAQIIKESGAIEYADSLSEFYANKAIEIVENVKAADTEALNMFKELVMFMIRRNY